MLPKMNFSAIVSVVLLILLSASMITSMPRRAKNFRRIRPYRIQAGGGNIGFVRFNDCEFNCKER